MLPYTKQVNSTGKRRAGCGCSGLGVLILVLVALCAVFVWPVYLNAAGTRTTGVIAEKRESVRIELGDWFRRFQVTAAYSIPGHPFQHRAVCDVDEKTYDSLHRGTPVEVHYFGNLVNQPFLSAAGLSPCSAMAPVVDNERLLAHLLVIVVVLAAIVLLWQVLRIRLLGWLLLAWVAVAFADLAMPRVEPQPQQPVQAAAAVDSIDTVTTLGETDDNDGLPLLHPYQLVRLEYVPQGMDTAVVAIDKIDEGSVAGLKKGGSAPIVYDAAHPRIAMLQGATRQFSRQAWIEVILCGVGLTLLLLAWLGLRGLFRLARRSLF